MLPHKLKSVAKNFNILYIEDEEDARIQITEILKMFFKNVIVAVNGKDGFEKFQSEPVDLVLSDVTMPIMGGIELIKKIITLQPDVKTIVMTAHYTGQALLEKEDLTTTHILYKPIDLTDTLQLLYNVCKNMRIP